MRPTRHSLLPYVPSWLAAHLLILALALLPAGDRGGRSLAPGGVCPAAADTTLLPASGSDQESPAAEGTAAEPGRPPGEEAYASPTQSYARQAEAGEDQPGGEPAGEGRPEAEPAGEGHPGAEPAGEGHPGAEPAGEGHPGAEPAGEGRPGAEPRVEAEEVLPGTVTVTEGVLHLRGLAGYQYRDLRAGEADSLGLPDRRGVVVSHIFPGTAAEEAGLRPDDVVRAYGLNLIADAGTMTTASRRFHAGDIVPASVVRDGMALSVPIALRPSLPPAAAGIDLQITEFATDDGARLRAHVMSPAARGGQRLPALFIVSALTSPSLDALPRYNPVRQIAETVARAGFRVLRFELRGAGDSEGQDYRERDFASEVADNRAALRYLRSRVDVDPERVFVWGHSTGGMVAAVLASTEEVRGLCVSGTIGRNLFERSAETVRRQGELGGARPEEVEARVVDHLELLGAVAAGATRASLEADPEMAPFLNASGRIHDDRTVAYWRQQLALNLTEVYGRIQEPALIVYPASDFLTLRADHEHIARVLRAAGNRDVRLEIIAGMDHAFARAASFAESYVRYGSSHRVYNPAFAHLLVNWMRARSD